MPDELLRQQLSDMISKLDDVISQWKISESLWNVVDFPNLPIFASFHRADRDLQKDRHLQMPFTYDAIDVSTAYYKRHTLSVTKFGQYYFSRRLEFARFRFVHLK